MSPAGEPAEETGPLRSCIATGEMQSKDGLIRFVLSPEQRVVPDLAEKLPGRGVWVAATAEALEAAIKGKRFARAFRRQVTVDAGMADAVATMLYRRCLDWLSLANKGGLATVGFAKVEPLIAAGKAALLLQAADAGSEGAKLLTMQEKRGKEVISIFTRVELGAAFGRDALVHVALKAGGTTERLQREIRRAAGFPRNLAVYDSTINTDDTENRVHD